MITSLFLLSLLFLGGICAQSGWKGYVDELMGTTDTVTHAAILDRAGEVWAKDSRFHPSQQEIQKIVSLFNLSIEYNEYFGQSFSLMGHNYEIIEAGIGTLHGRHEGEAFFAVSTKELIICVAYERTGPKNLIIRMAAQRLATFLRIMGY